MRYELHRVWQVEANLKSGSKHIYGKRVFFLDEDTWTVVYEDAYDTRKQLWRIGVHPMMQFYDAKVPWYRANTWYDLNNASYYSRWPRQRSQEPVEVRPEGQVGRLPAGRAAPHRHEVSRPMRAPTWLRQTMAGPGTQPGPVAPTARRPASRAGRFHEELGESRVRLAGRGPAGRVTAAHAQDEAATSTGRAARPSSISAPIASS